jgi:hypothetical protein
MGAEEGGFGSGRTVCAAWPSAAARGVAGRAEKEAVLVEDAEDNGGIAGIEVVCGSGIGGCGGGGEERGLIA